ncbi:MAG: RsmD family RNA methyltransferase, partial [Flavobacteriales bacterium]
QCPRRKARRQLRGCERDLRPAVRVNNHFYFDDVCVLDLFSGTGNISYEFASRGTKDIIAVDENFGCIKFINQTSEGFKMPIKTIKSDVFKFLEKASLKFNIIFADPPYAFTLEQFSKIPELVFQNKLLEDDGVLIVEHSKETNLSHLEYYSYSKSYGGNMFSFFEYETSQ